ncbi:hypothetical protein OQJ13_11670 [Legionella sp. PATHC035]|uniref:hypothetical protein n=1 Tax=Legionella sp. PATHC035 TaxID=2992040 RepID=UPI0022448071|nr:hypothetical protein [Legionella sp. PATHC035]MCW8409629.1 hypothetical protein [Legionella sp. PATHC035]
MGSYGCAQGECHCPCHYMHEEHHHGDHGHCDHAHGEEMPSDYFLELADEAWEELLIDKIKAYILKTQNDRMEKLAKLVAEGNHHRWKNKMEKKQVHQAFMDEISNFFHESKK